MLARAARELASPRGLELTGNLRATRISGGVDVSRVGRSISGDVDDHRRRARLGKVRNIRRFRIEAPSRQLLDGERVRPGAFHAVELALRARIEGRRIDGELQPPIAGIRRDTDDDAQISARERHDGGERHRLDQLAVRRLMDGNRRFGRRFRNRRLGERRADRAASRISPPCLRAPAGRGDRARLARPDDRADDAPIGGTSPLEGARASHRGDRCAEQDQPQQADDQREPAGHQPADRQSLAGRAP